MRIVWDEPKRLRNIALHGLDFADLRLDFFDEAIIAQANLRRLKAVGLHRDGTIAVIFVHLGTEALSLISMRPASRKERRLYEQDF
jgi:uncharacterized DUF497 family protein